MNVCTNPRCEDYFGVPVPSDVKNDADNFFGHFKLAKSTFQMTMKCKGCKKVLPVISNKAVYEERQKYLVAHNPSPARKTCPNPECYNHKEGVLVPGPEYISYGHVSRGGKIGAQRFKCKECERVFIVDRRSFRRRRGEDVAVSVFEHLTGSTPISKTIRIAKTGGGTYYSTLEFIYKQCVRFAGYHERKIKTLDRGHLQLSVDCQQLSANWRPERLIGDKVKRYPILYTLGSVDNNSGYIFGLSLNFDASRQLREIDAYFTANKEHNRFRHEWEYTRFVSSFDTLYAKQKGQGQYTPPTCGVKIQETILYTGHFLYLRELLGGAYDRLTFYTDGDVNFQGTIARAFAPLIREGLVNHFVVDFGKGKGKESSGSQKQHMTRREIRKKLKEIKKAHPDYDDQALNKAFVLERYDQQTGTDNPWVEHPHPLSTEKDLKTWHATPNPKISQDDLAEMILNATERSVSLVFDVLRDGIRGFVRPVTTASGEVKYSKHGMFNPKYIVYMLEIFRVWHNFADALKPPRLRGKNKPPEGEPKPPRRKPVPYTEKPSRAVRIGLCPRLYSIEEILNFVPPDNEE